MKTNRSVEQTIRAEFPGKSNEGVRAEIRRVISAPVDELWPVPLAERVRGLARKIAFTAQGRHSLEVIAKSLPR